MRTRLGLVALVIASASTASGQQFEAGGFPAVTLDEPRSVGAADFDGDGDEDLLALGWGQGLVVWYPNDGVGGFDVALPVCFTTAPDAALPADLDGDGLLDVLVATGAGPVFLCRNVGGGVFEAKAPFGGGVIDSARDIALGDMDGDGDLDALVADLTSAVWTAGEVVWFANDGAGGFSTPVVVAAEFAEPRAVRPIDANADGSLDVVAAWDQQDTIRWYRNTGGGSGFVPNPVIDGAADGVRDLAVADFDGDGTLDVAAALFYDADVAWYRNADGLGGFGPRQVIDGAANAAAVVHATDVDGDGATDVVADSSGQAVWYRNTGSGGFGTGTVVAFVPYLLDAGSGDLDGDGDLDLILGGGGVLDQLDWAQNADGAGGAWLPQQVGARADGVEWVHTADLDGDGDPDLLSASGNDDRVAWYPFVGGATGFGEQRTLTESAQGASCVHAADLNGDGDNDILWAAWDSDRIAWHPSLGAGLFGAEDLISDTVDGAAVAEAADLDGDGDLDVLTASGFGSVAWFPNVNGLGDFAGESVISPVSASRVRATDLDLDGDLDVLMASASTDQVAWFPNQGGASFGPKSEISLSEDAEDVVAADLDLDGDLDLVVADNASSTVGWYEADGGGFSALRVIDSTGTNAAAVEVADLDGDGDPDVLAAWRGSNEAVAYANFGGGSFGAAQVWNKADSMETVVTGDFDGDGDPDVVTGASADDEVAWLHNTTGACAPAGPIPSVEQPRAGVPPNPLVLMPGATSGPVNGKTWDPWIDHTSFLPGALVDAIAVTALPANQVAPPLGTILVDLSSLLVVDVATFGAPLAIDIPWNPCLLGLQLYAQGASSANFTTFQATNALDISLGSQ